MLSERNKLPTTKAEILNYEGELVAAASEGCQYVVDFTAQVLQFQQHYQKLMDAYTKLKK